jgi:hypothetical protein
MRSPKFFLMGWFGLFGLFQIVLYRDGLMAWLRICSLPFSQIKGTAYEELWTSLRAVGGILFLTAALVWFMADRHKGDSGKEGNTGPTAGGHSR